MYFIHTLTEYLNLFTPHLWYLLLLYISQSHKCLALLLLPLLGGKRVQTGRSVLARVVEKKKKKRRCLCLKETLRRGRSLCLVMIYPPTPGVRHPRLSVLIFADPPWCLWICLVLLVVAWQSPWISMKELLGCCSLAAPSDIYCPFVVSHGVVITG